MVTTRRSWHQWSSYFACGCFLDVPKKNWIVPRLQTFDIFADGSILFMRLFVLHLLHFLAMLWATQFNLAKFWYFCCNWSRRGTKIVAIWPIQIYKSQSLIPTTFMLRVSFSPPLSVSRFIAGIDLSDYPVPPERRYSYDYCCCTRLDKKGYIVNAFYERRFTLH